MDFEPAAQAAEQTAIKAWPVQCLRQQGESVLLSYVIDGQERRCWLPANVVTTTTEGSLVEYAELDRGVQYGVPWAQLMTPRALDPKEVEVALHNVGIWTLDDLKHKVNEAIGAIQFVYHLDLAALLMMATSYAKED